MAVGLQVTLYDTEHKAGEVPVGPGARSDGHHRPQGAGTGPRSNLRREARYRKYQVSKSVIAPKRPNAEHRNLR